MNDQLEVLKSVVQRLNKQRIPYMISGSVAMNFYAQPRMTRDIDIVVDLQLEDADELTASFQDDFYLDAETVLRAIRERGIFNLIHLGRIVKVDFIVRQDSSYRRTELKRRKKVTTEGVEFWLVSPEDLLLSKLVWAADSHSELQLGDARNLLRSVTDLDMGYIRHWAPQLSVLDLLQEVLS